MKFLLLLAFTLMSLLQVGYPQNTNRVKVIHIIPSEDTGQDYSPWLTDHLDTLIQSSWGKNQQWVDVKLIFQYRSTLSKLSLYDANGIFADNPASIYALKDNHYTFLGLFDGSKYNTYVDLNIPNPVVADAIVVRKFGNNIPQKIKIYGEQINGAVSADTINNTNPLLKAKPATLIGYKIPINPKKWYQLNHFDYGLDALFDGNIINEVFTGWGKVLENYDAYYPLEIGETINIQSVKFYDGNGIFINKPFKLYGITAQWERVLIATFAGNAYNQWVGPNPKDMFNFVIPEPSKANFRYLVINSFDKYPREMELYGTYTPSTVSYTLPPLKDIKMKDAFGINAFEWDFLTKENASVLDENKVKTFKPFTAFRQYMDWERLEHFENVYTYNPCYNGGWNYDAIYERCKIEGIEVLPCLQGVPDWLFNSYPDSTYHDSQIIPARYGYSFTDPNAYRDQAQVGFQYVARYGSNTQVDKRLLSVFDQPRWIGDSPNTLKVGMNIIKYIECGNERDKWWKGRKAYQTAREYAANLSAFYDGHKNTMGPGIGVKNADPNIKVVMAGLASADPGYVRGMIDWCKEFRGFKADGKVDLCWDIINFHLYSDNANSTQSGTSTRAKAPEISSAPTIAKEFVQLAHEHAYDMPVWVTELGFDLNQESILKAIPIANKSASITQADWGLRSALMYNRLGIEKSFFYKLYDFNLNDPIRFSSSGLIDSLGNRRPIADYFLQTKNLIGEYIYKETISQDPLVDRYDLNGKSAYVLMIPDEVGRTANYTLNLENISKIKIYHPKSGSDQMDSLIVKCPSEKFEVTVSETPTFILLEKDPIDNGNKITTVYPNPSSDAIFILIDDIAKINYVKLTNIKGTTLFETKNINTNEINIKALPSGNYFLTVHLKDGSIENHKVMISK